LLGVPPKSALLAGDGAAACRALSDAVDREALARLLPPGVAAAAFGLLPGWLSGYESLFRHAPDQAQPAAGLPRGALRLIHDASDPVGRLIASRLTFDFRALGVELRVDSLPRAAYAAARESAPHELYLESARLGTAAPGVALAELLQRYQIKGDMPGLFVISGSPDVRAEAQYRIEREALDTARVIPLLHYRDLYTFQPGLEQVRLDESGFLDLANAWKR
jgi:MarR-like DNA-binding transcriptional regulator SgrR of sgrS sRNA